MTHSHSRFPPGHIRLTEFLRIAGISKNTFFLKYRDNPEYAAVLAARKGGLPALYLARAAAEQIARERSHKAPHGNKGRAPRRPCTACGGHMHPRHRACPACGAEAPRRAVRHGDAVTAPAA